MKIKTILENISAQQRSVGQLPADFRPPQTSPQLNGPYPGRNATRGYLVGESQEPINAMAQAVTRRIVNRHPEWISQYGAEFLMQVIDDVTEGEDDWEEIGSSDVSAFVRMVQQQLQDRAGSREEMRSRRPFAESKDGTARQIAQMLRRTHPNPSEATEREILAATSRVLSDQGMRDVQVRFYLRDPDFQSDTIEAVQALLQGVAEAMKPSDIPPSMRQRLTMRDIEKERPAGAFRFRVTYPDGAYSDFMDFEAAQRSAERGQGKINRLSEGLRDGEHHVATVTLDDGSVRRVRIHSDEGFRDQIKQHFQRQGHAVKKIDVDFSVRSDRDLAESREQQFVRFVRGAVAEGMTSEDVLSTMKKKLGDYLQDVATAIRKDPDLKKRLPSDVDRLGPAVRTLRTDDGHEIKIHGNEDDGFRISIRDRSMPSKFGSMAEAEMATEMYCAQRRERARLQDDYIDEA